MRRLWMFGALLAAGLAVGACSGDDEDENDDDSGSGYTGSGTDGTSDGDGTSTLADGTDTGTGDGTGDGTGTGTGTTTGATTVGGPNVTTGGVPLGTPDERYGLSTWPVEGAGFEECTAEMQIPEPYNVVLMFVVDVSGSMTQAAPGTNASKWKATYDALRETVLTLPPQVGMGIVYYPNYPEPGPLEHTEPTDDPSECVNVDGMVPPDVVGDLQSAHRAALNASLDNVYVYGGTPTYVAYTVGLQALQQSNLPGNKYVVLITDGEPTYGVGCVGNGTTLPANMDPAYINDTLAVVEAAYVQAMPPIGTFVIGSPGSEKNYSGNDARPWLSAAARLGGTAPIDCTDTGPAYCHFDLTDPNENFAAGLTNALAQILGQVVACEYSPPVPPADQQLDTELVSVKFVNGNKEEFYVPLVGAGDCQAGAQGWYWTAGGTVALCPATCGLVRADALAGIAVLYGCERELT